MDFTGLIPKFQNNRPLSDAERQHRLLQKKRLDVPLLAQLCVVKMDSQRLVSVDRWYGWRGFVALMGAIPVAFAIWGVVYFSGLLAFGGLPDENGLWEAVYVCIAMFVALGAFGAWLAGKELFRWTHYPILLDRKHRQVHVFRLDGTVLSAPWDKIYFTLGRGKGLFGSFNWDIRGLILDDDGQTVRETFAFCIATSRQENAYSHWEFLRRYMEEGPQAVIQEVKFCMPVDGRRESFAFSKERVFANDAQSPGLMYITMIPFNYLHTVMRWAVMRTSRIPAFPADIEASLAPDPHDVYVRDASINPEDLR
jgi:hypothetical protein